MTLTRQGEKACSCSSRQVQPYLWTARLLKWRCNPKSVLQAQGRAVGTGSHLTRLPSCAAQGASAHTVSKCSFHSLFIATFSYILWFLLVTLWSKVVPGGVPSAVLQWEPVMCPMEKTRELDALPAGGSHSAVSQSSTLVNQHYQWKRMSLNRNTQNEAVTPGLRRRWWAEACREPPLSAQEQQLTVCNSVPAAGLQNLRTVSNDNPLTCDASKCNF